MFVYIVFGFNKKISEQKLFFLERINESFKEQVKQKRELEIVIYRNIFFLSFFFFTFLENVFSQG